MIKRDIAPNLKRLSQQYPVVSLTGPRQSGKTTLCKMVFPKYSYANLEDLETRQLAVNDPKGFLSQFKNGVVLDEIQRAPDLASYIQAIVDIDQSPGQFILTGSQQFEVTTTINQSLAWRFALLKLLPLSYVELMRFRKIELETLLYAGFYPRIYSSDLNPTEALSFYLSTYVERDIRTLLNVKNLNTFERFLKLCAANVGQLVSYTRLANDCGVNQNTIKEWLSILSASFITYELTPHFNNFRKRMVKSTKIYFYDVGLLCYLLSITNAEHLMSHPLQGSIYENFIILEFLKMRCNTVKNDNLYFFRDNTGNEVDLLLDYGSEVATVEIKSAKTISSHFFKNLNFYAKLNSKNLRRYLIYAGNNNQKISDINIFSYKNLPELLKELQEI